MFSDGNIAPMLSLYTIMGYSTTYPKNNKIAQINSISKHTSEIDEYSASVTDSVTVFWLCEWQVMTNILSRTIYSVTIFWVLLYPA